MAWTKVCIHMYARSYRRFDASPVTVTCLSHHSDGVMGVYDAALSAVLERWKVTTLPPSKPFGRLMSDATKSHGLQNLQCLVTGSMIHAPDCLARIGTDMPRS